MGLRISNPEEQAFIRYAHNAIHEAEKRIDEIIKNDMDQFRREYGDGPRDRRYTVSSVRGQQRKKSYMFKVIDKLNEESWQKFKTPITYL